VDKQELNAKSYALLYVAKQLLLLVFVVLFGVPIFRFFTCPAVLRRRSGRRGRWGAFDVTCAVFLLESLYSAGGINVFLFAGIERMAHRADFSVDFFCCAAGLESITATAVNHHLIVFRMYSFFHNCGTLIYLML